MTVAKTGAGGIKSSDELDVDVTGDVLKAVLGVSHETVRRLANDEIIVKSARGRYSLLASIHGYTSHLRDMAAGRGGDEDIASLARERTMLAREKRQEVELKNAKLRGELVPVTEVRQTWSGILSQVRSVCLSIPGRVRSALPHLTTADVDTVDRIVRRLLEDMADDKPVS